MLDMIPTECLLRFRELPIARQVDDRQQSAQLRPLGNNCTNAKLSPSWVMYHRLHFDTVGQSKVKLQ